MVGCSICASGKATHLALLDRDIGHEVRCECTRGQDAMHIFTYHPALNRSPPERCLIVVVGGFEEKEKGREDQ